MCGHLNSFARSHDSLTPPAQAFWWNPFALGMSAGAPQLPSKYDASSAQGMGFFRDILFDALALVSFAGVYGYFLIQNLAKHSIYPCGDPRLEESVNVAN